MAVGRRAQAREVREPAEIVGLSRNDTGGVVVTGYRQCLEVGNTRAFEKGDLQYLNTHVAGVGSEHLPVHGIDGSVHDGFGSTRHAYRHKDGLIKRCCAVVHTRVGRVQAAEGGDHGLIFVNGLERALHHFRLVRRVGSEELRP